MARLGKINQKGQPKYKIGDILLCKRKTDLLGDEQCKVVLLERWDKRDIQNIAWMVTDYPEMKSEPFAVAEIHLFEIE